MATIATGVGFFASPAAGQGRLAYAKGVEALARHDIAAATREFGRAAADSNRALHSAGEQWLGHLSWMIFADAHAASAHLDRAMASATDTASVLIERARLEGFEHRYRDATKTAAHALSVAIDDEHRGVAARTITDLAAEGAFAALSGRTRVGDSVDDPVVHIARDTLRARVDRFPGRTSDALGLMTSGVLLHDDAAVRKGWMSYFTLADDATAASLGGARRLIEADSLASGLALSRLYELAALVVGSGTDQVGGVADSSRSDVLVYGRFLHDLRLRVNHYYRRAIIGGTKAGDLDRIVNAQTRLLWRDLRWGANKSPPPYAPAAVPAELRRRFGTVIKVEPGAVIAELTLAHVEASFAPRVPGEQVPPLERQVVLDGLVNNGIDHWLLDGSGGRAGWASGDSIFEVRTEFTETPFRAWLAVADPGAIPGEMLRLQRDSITDIVRARADSTAYLPGVAARILRRGTSAIFDSLSRGPVSYAECEREFVGILFRHLTLTTITIHETRHVVDLRPGNRLLSGAEAEFRAKVDEVSVAPRPTLALTAILHPNIGDETPHGQANRRIMLGLIRWMRANSATIVGFDGSLPVLVQLPLLTDAQLRTAFQSMRRPI
jgi:hypothetical protein